MSLPRQLNPLPSQDCSHSTGSMISRSSHSSGDRHDSGQPAVAVRPYSEPSQMATNSRAGQHLRQLQPPGGQHTTGQRREQPGEYLQRIDEREGRPPQPRPAQLARPDARQRAQTERLRECAIDQAHAQALLAHDLGRGRILGELRTQRMDAAGALQVDAPPEQRLALREAVAEAVGGELPARLVAVQEGAFQLGPQVGGRVPIGGAETSPVPGVQAANSRSM